MKQWLETTQVLEEIAALLSRRQVAALATVVGVRQSAYRRPGAKLLVTGDGRSVGNVSGGCLEQDVREVALRVMESGVSELRSYCSGADPIDAWDLGVGCEGEVEVYVQPVRSERAGLRQSLRGDRPFAFCSICEAGDDGSTEGLLVGAAGSVGTLGDSTLDAMVAGGAHLLPDDAPSGLHEIGGRTVFIDRFHPPPHLVVFGAGEDARPLVRLALETGFRVTVVDRRPALLDEERFPPGTRLVRASASSLDEHLTLAGESYVLLMTHSFADDVAYAAAVATRPIRYLGILGPRARTERLVGSFAPALMEDPRLHGPVGLDIGTEGAEQVAVSIVAELLAVRSGRTGEPLRDRSSPIHTGAR